MSNDKIVKKEEYLDNIIRAKVSKEEWFALEGEVDLFDFTKSINKLGDPVYWDHGKIKAICKSNAKWIYRIKEDDIGTEISISMLIEVLDYFVKNGNDTIRIFGKKGIPVFIESNGIACAIAPVPLDILKTEMLHK